MRSTSLSFVTGCNLWPSKFYFSVRVEVSRLSSMLQRLRYVIIICAAKLYDSEPHKGLATSIYKAHSNFNQRIDLSFCISSPVSKITPMNTISWINGVNETFSQKLQSFSNHIFFRMYIIHQIAFFIKYKLLTLIFIILF